MEKKKILAFAVFCVVLISSAVGIAPSAQKSAGIRPPTTKESKTEASSSFGGLWAKTYSIRDLSGVSARSICPTMDGGHVITGHCYYSSSDGWQNACVLKINRFGKIEWKWISGWDSYANSVCQTADGCYAVTGALDCSGSQGLDFLLIIKFDANGNILWQKKYCVGTGHSIKPTNDGGVIVAGDYFYYKDTQSSSGGLVMKLDAQGSVEWKKAVEYSDYFKSIAKTHDGGYVAAGSNVLVKFSASGQVEWQKSYGVYNKTLFSEVISTSDGGYALAGDTESSGVRGRSACIVKLDPSGGIQWQYSYIMNNLQSSSHVDYANSLLQTSDGGYLVTGWGYTNYPNHQALILKLNPWGGFEWAKTFVQCSCASEALQTEEGGYIIAGYLYNYDREKDGSLVIRTNSSGEINPDCSLLQNAGLSEMKTAISPVDISLSFFDLPIVPENDSGYEDSYDFTENFLCAFKPVLTMTAVSGGTTDPEPGTYIYEFNTTATLSAVPNDNYVFERWKGDVLSGRIKDNPLKVIMDRNKTIKPVYVKNAVLTISASTGGTTDPAPGTYYYVPSSKAVVKAVPDALFAFDQWSGDAPAGEIRSNPLALIMDRDKSVQASFLRKVFPPLHFAGRKIANRSLVSVEYLNELTWGANPDNADIRKYRIHLIDGGTEQLLTETGSAEFLYRHRKVEKDKEYRYAVSAVNGDGRESERAYVTVK